MMSTPHSTLHQVFGYHAFRGAQEAVISHVVAGGDALVLMPTGGGKSLCYQIPALLRPGVAVVVSPLIALMEDQVNALLQLGIKAERLHSGMSLDELREVAARMRQQDLDLLYVAPERLMTERFLSFLDQTQVALFAIDEAHCVSQWGHDFRPEYRQLSVLHERFPEVPRIALTATADGPTRREIIERLRLEEAEVYVSSFDRPNIRYWVEEKSKDARGQLLRFLNAEHKGDAGVVYCLSRKKVESTALWLQQQGWNALPYHAGLPAETRSRHQARFLREEGLVMVATVAFGMGIDKPNVRFVAHLDLPKSMESYYQETGRAGRDGLPANAWLAYGLEDVVTLRKLMAQSEADEQRKRVERNKLDALLSYCEITTCRRQSLLAYFDDELAEPCGNCDVCLQPPETWDASEAARKALSCVYRSGQRYGANHLIDVLLGKSLKKILDYGHDRLSTYGIGKDLSQETWRSVFRQLTAQGLLEVDVEGYGCLYLTDKARPVLRGEQQLFLRKARETESSSGGGSSRRASLVDSFAGSDLVLWQALRARRLKLCQEQDPPVAPYMIFHDATLAEMVCHCPLTLDEMAEISGVGQLKLQRYGAAFLEVITEHLDEHDAPAKPPRPAVSLETAEDTVSQSLGYLRKGLSVEEIAAQRGLKQNTIYGHLAEAIELGRLALNEIKEISEEDVQRIAQTWQALPDAEQGALKPLYLALGEAYEYNILRCVLTMLRQSAENK